MRPATVRRYRGARLLLAGAAAAFALFIALMHGAAFLFSLHDRSMKAYASKSIAGPAGQTLHYYELLQNDPVWNIIFVHGTPATAAVFGEQFERPYPQTSLFALDRPGFGKSGPAPRRPSLDAQAESIGLLLAEIGPRPAILVGHSYGAPVVLAAALRYTNRVKGVILLGGSIDPAQERTFLAQRIAAMPIFSWLMPQALRQCNRELLSLKADLVELQPRLAALQIPVVMVHGAKDRQVPVANVDYVRAQFLAAGKADLFDALVFPDFNHFIPWEHPAAVEAALNKVTDRIRKVRLAGQELGTNAPAFDGARN